MVVKPKDLIIERRIAKNHAIKVQFFDADWSKKVNDFTNKNTAILINNSTNLSAIYLESYKTRQLEKIMPLTFPKNCI